MKCRADFTGALGYRCLSIPSVLAHTGSPQIVSGWAALTPSCGDALGTCVRQTDTKGPLHMSDGLLAEGSLCR